MKEAIQAAAQLKEVSRRFAILGIIDHKTYMDNKAEVTAKVLEVLDKMEGVSTGAWGYLFSTLKGELRRFHLKRAIGFSCRCVQGAPFSGID